MNPSNDGTCARHWIPAHGKQVGHNRQQCQHHLWWMVIRVLTVTMEMVTSVWRDQKSDSDRFREFFRYQIFSNGLRTFFQYRFRDFFQYQIFFETDSEVIFGTEFFAVPNFFGTGFETFLVPIAFWDWFRDFFGTKFFRYHQIKWQIPGTGTSHSDGDNVELWWWGVVTPEKSQTPVTTTRLIFWVNLCSKYQLLMKNLKNMETPNATVLFFSCHLTAQ